MAAPVATCPGRENAVRVESIAVIGAGPGGLAAAKYLQAEDAFSTIVLFEQRRAVGGLWNATPLLPDDGSFAVPSTRPRDEPAPAVYRGVACGGDEFDFLSPVYNELETNIPQSLMRYSDLPFPAGSALFPRHDVVQEYLEQYADGDGEGGGGGVRDLVRFGVQVLDVRPVDASGGWAVRVRDLKTGEESVSMFDAIVVASGHYNDPFVPDIPGIREWSAAYPGSISHSKFYRRPSEFKGKKVIVVGNSASGVDLAAQISTVSQSPLLLSERNPAAIFVPVDDTSAIKEVPEISQFVIRNRSVQFTNGHVESFVDHIIFCTGYLYSFPFLRTLDPPAVTATGSYPQNLYQQIFYIPRPTLSFIALPQRIVPFPISECQAAVIARVLSGRLMLPPQQEMRAWEDDMVARHANGKAFYVLGFPRDAEYIDFLHAWRAQAAQRPDHASGNDGRDKTPPRWSVEEQWVRQQIPLIKAAARKLGAQRSRLTTLKELGFDFEKWKREGQDGEAEDAASRQVLQASAEP